MRRLRIMPETMLPVYGSEESVQACPENLGLNETSPDRKSGEELYSLIRVVMLAVHSTCMAIVLLALWHWRPAALLTPVKFLTNLASRRVGLCIFMLCGIAPAIRLLEVPWLGVPDPRSIIC